MNDRPTKGMTYLNLGPWPGFVGLCFDEKVFHREMRRTGVKEEVAFLGPNGHAALHNFVSPFGERWYLLALGPTKGRSKEQVAGLIAHEATHLIQGMREDLAQGKSLGDEAEAYLVQMIVQEALQILWKSRRIRRREPATSD